MGRFRHEMSYNFLALADDTVQSSVIADFDNATFGLLGVFVDFRASQCNTVHDGAVTACASQDDGILGRSLVKIISKRPPLLGHKILRPPITCYPLASADFVDFVPDQALDLLDRCGFCQVNIPLRLAAQVRVRVDKTRHNEPAVEVDRDWRDELRKELLAAHSDDFVVLDCNRRLN